MRMEFVRKASCLFLAATCVFLTGCHSILYDGNLHFKSYEPETVPLLYDEVSDEMNSFQRELDANRFNVEGTDAFFIFPCHISDPDQVLDFKLLDYTDAGTFVYAYMTEYVPGSVHRYLLPVDPLCGNPEIGQVLDDGSIGPATIDMLGDRTVPKETSGVIVDEDLDETLPPPPTEAISESVHVETETELETELDLSPGGFLAAVTGGSDVSASAAGMASDQETETYTFDPGELWWDDAGALSGTTAAPSGTTAAAGPAQSADDLWWDTGESEGIGHVDWSAAESEAASAQASWEAVSSEEASREQESREQASREQESREQASREEAARSAADMSEWWNESSQSGEGTDETLYFNDPTSEGESAVPTGYGGSDATGTGVFLDSEIVYVATVLMAYDPQNRVYKVFYAAASPRTAKLTTDEATGEKKYELASTEITLSANKLVKAEEYFIFDEGYGYVYDRDGDEIFWWNYKDAISSFCQQKKQDIFKQVLADSGYAKNSIEYWRFYSEMYPRIFYGEVTISNVVMDGLYFVYIPFTIQLADFNKAPAAGEKDIMDMDADEADETVTEEIYQAIMVCMEVDIGGSDPNVKFYSENTSWEKQKEKWLSYDELTIPQEVAISNEEELDTYLDSIGASMDEIKKSVIPDVFPAFHESSLGLSLAYLPDVSSFEGAWTVYNVYDPLNYNRLYYISGSLSELYEGLYRGYDRGRIRELEHFWEDPSHNYSAALSALALMAMGDADTKRGWLKKIFPDYIASDSYAYMLVPWMTPGSWNPDNGRNESPLPYEIKTPKGADEYHNIWEPGKQSERLNDKMEAILAGRAIATGSGYDERSTRFQYIPILVGGRNEYDKTVQYSMQPVEYTESLTRTVKQEKEEKVARKDESGNVVKDESGNVIYDVKKTTTTYEQTLSPLPLKYQFFFPAGTKMTMMEELESTAMVAPAGEMGAVLYEDEAEQDSTSRLTIYGAGVDVFKDKGIKGHASDAGILYHKDSSGRETELLTLITDEGVQFYRQADSGGQENKNRRWWNRYLWAAERAGIEGGDSLLYDLSSEYVSGWTNSPSDRFFISSAEFATRTTNYGLNTISQAEFDNQGSAAIEGVSEAQNQVIREKLNTGAGMDALSVSNLSLLNDREIVVSSINEGLFMVNLKSHQALSLRAGAFYSAISYQKGGSERFMLVGFDTTEYYYQPMDIVKAKCYDMDLVAENREHENQAMQAHLTTLAYNYLNRTHRIEASQSADGKTTNYYINEAESDAEKAANEQARKLFFGTELSMQQELYKIVSSVGFGYTQRILNFTTELRQKLLTQREKLKEFYALCGLGNISGLLDPATGMPNDVELREQEGALIHANYTSTLEHMLVTLKLSEDAIDGMASNQEEYREYRRQMQEAEKAQSKLQNSQSEGADDDFVAAKDVSLVSDQLSDDGLDYLEKMDFYRAVLSDVTKAYEDGEYQKYDKIRVSWEDYMKELLNAISPDNAVNQQERSFEQFCKLAQIDVSIMNEEQVTELRDRLSEIDRVVDLELLIVEYKLKTAEYQSSPYQEEYSEFQDKTFEEETERVKAAQSAGFHEIIVKLAADAAKEKLLDGTDWETEMKDIVALCGSGIVWDPNTAEMFTEESSG